MLALAKEAIHISATLTSIEDSEKFFKGVLAAAKQMQAAHQKEQGAIAAVQADVDALEPSNDKLLGISPKESDARSGDGDNEKDDWKDDGDDDSDDDEAKAEVEVKDDEEVEPEESKQKKREIT